MIIKSTTVIPHVKLFDSIPTQSFCRQGDSYLFKMHDHVLDVCKGFVYKNRRVQFTVYTHRKKINNQAGYQLTVVKGAHYKDGYIFPKVHIIKNAVIVLYNTKDHKPKDLHIIYQDNKVKFFTFDNKDFVLALKGINYFKKAKKENSQNDS